MTAGGERERAAGGDGDADGPPSASVVRRRPPRLPVAILDRPRLVGLPERAGWPPLALVVAPTGFGKTTLLRQWIDAAPFPAAWLSVDKADDGLPAFAGSLAAAIADAVPALEAPLRHIPPAAAIGAEAWADALADVLAGLPERLLVSIDDLHQLEAPEVGRLLARLMRFPVPGCTVALGARRSAPEPLPLATLRARGGLVEVRAAGLRFTADETDAFLAMAEVDAAEAPVVAGMAAGWPAGLRLLALGGSREDGLGRRVGHAAEFLATELLPDLTPTERRALWMFAVNGHLAAPSAEQSPEHCAESPATEAAAWAPFVIDDGAGEAASQRCHPLLLEAVRRDAGFGEPAADDRPALDQLDSGTPLAAVAFGSGVADAAGWAMAVEPGMPAGCGVLSEREREVLAGMVRRLTDKEIAAELRISPLTVKRHACSIYAKLGVTGRREAARRVASPATRGDLRPNDAGAIEAGTALPDR